MHLNIGSSFLQNQAGCRRRREVLAARLSVLLLATIALLGCPAEQKVVAAATNSDSSVSVTELDNGKSVELAKGQTLLVRLASNPTTGYQWMQQGDPAPLELMKSDFASDAQGEKRVGAGGTQVFQFTAKSAGKAMLNLEYRRPWEKNVPAAKTFKVTVIVK